MGPDSYSVLMTFLKGDDDNVRYQAARGLSTMGSLILPGLEEFIEVLRDDDAGIVCSILDCLGNLGKAAAKAIPEIEKAMKRFPENGSLQRAGNEALTKIAGGAENHIV
jgi:hypothetical protein